MLKKNVAIIIDGENTYKNGLLTSLIKHIEENNENIVLKRIYGDFSTAALKGWQQDIALHNLDVKHNYALIKGKNSSDIFIALDLQERILREQGVKNKFDLLEQIQDFNLTENIELKAITTILKSQKEKEISQHIDKVYLLSCDSDFNGLGTSLKNSHIEVVCVAKSTDFNFNYLFYFDKFFCYMPKFLSENDKKELSLISPNLKAFTKFVEIELNKNFEKKHLESLKDFAKKLTSSSSNSSTILEMENENIINTIHEEKHENLEKENNGIVNIKTFVSEVSGKFPEVKIDFFKHILYSLSKGMANEQKNKFASLKKNVLSVAETNLSRFYGEVKTAYHSDGASVSSSQNFKKHFENVFKVYGYKDKIGKATSFKNIHSKIELLVTNNEDRKTELNLPLLKDLIGSGALNFQYILERNSNKVIYKNLKDLSCLYHYLKTQGINLFNGMDFSVINNKETLKNIQSLLMDDELKQVDDILLKITTEENLRKQEKLNEIEQQETNQVVEVVNDLKNIESVENSNQKEQQELPEIPLEVDTKNGSIVDMKSEINDEVNQNNVEKDETIEEIEGLESVKEINDLESEKIEDIKNVKSLNSGSDLNEIMRKEFEELKLAILDGKNFSGVKKAEREEIIGKISKAIFNHLEYKNASKEEKVKIKKDLVARFAKIFELSERTIESHYYGYENKWVI